jgi:hypothetical protein
MKRTRGEIRVKRREAGERDRTERRTQRNVIKKKQRGEERKEKMKEEI